MFAFKKNQRNEIEKTIILLSKALIIKKKRELKWVLRLYVICDYLKKALWLLQKVYIMKICNNLALSTSTNQLSTTLIEILEFFAVLNNENIMNALQTLY